MKLYLIYDEYRVGGNRISDDIYSCRDTEYVEWRPISIQISKMNGYSVEQLDIKEDIKIGDTVFLVVARYSDGDSFGQTEGLWSIQLVTSNSNTAFKLKNTLEKATDHPTRGYYPWIGYFSSLTGIQIHTLQVGK